MLEGSYGLNVELTPPDGIDITEDEDGNQLKGQIIYDFDLQDPESGDPVVVTQTLVSLRKTALRVVPESGQSWGVRIPLDPSVPETLTQFTINTDEAIMGGKTAGFITLSLKEIDQS